MTTTYMHGIACNASVPTIYLTVFMSGGSPPYTVQWTYVNGTQTATTNQNIFSTVLIPPEPYPCGTGPITPTASLSYIVTDALGCLHSVSVNLALNNSASSSRMSVANLTREVLPQPNNTVTMLFRYPQTGCGTLGALNNTNPGWFNVLTYSLIRDGAFQTSGNVSSIYQCPAPCNSDDHRIVFSELQAGSYTLTFDVTGQLNNPQWCQGQVPLYSVYLPNGNDLGVNVRIAAALGGSLVSGGLMYDSLRADGLVPLVEPYSAAGYVYVGTVPGASIAPALLATTGSTAVVDWVVAELRSPVAPYAVVASRPALIRRDGEVIDLDGDAYVNFSGLAAGSYRIALRHRNHLGVMTSTAHSLGFIPVRANFRAGGAYGTTPQTTVSGVQCLWPGDCAADGTIRYVGTNNDRDPILTAIGGSVPTAVVSNVYDARDVNMDGSIRYVGTSNDRDPILQTVGGTVPTATRVQQLP